MHEVIGHNCQVCEKTKGGLLYFCPSSSIICFTLFSILSPHPSLKHSFRQLQSSHLPRSGPFATRMSEAMLSCIEVFLLQFCLEPIPFSCPSPLSLSLALSIVVFTWLLVYSKFRYVSNGNSTGNCFLLY